MSLKVSAHLTAKLLASMLVISSVGWACMPADDAIDLTGSSTSSLPSGGGGSGGGVSPGAGGSPAAPVASGGSSGASQGGSSGGEPSGTGGKPASTGTGGKPAATGTGGNTSAPDAGGASDTAANPPPTMSNNGGDPWASCGGNSFKPNVSAEDYCAKFMSACSFGGAGGSPAWKTASPSTTRSATAPPAAKPAWPGTCASRQIRPTPPPSAPTDQRPPP
jgi:hypothetical protein